MKKEEILLFSQLSSSLNETFKKLEISYREKNVDEFNSSKKLFFQLQKKIEEMIK